MSRVVCNMYLVYIFVLFERSEFLIPTWVTPLYRATSKKINLWRLSWLQVSGVLQKKKEHTYRGHHLPWRKKKEKKKEKKRKNKKRCRVSNSQTLTGQSDGFTPYATAAWISKEHSRYLSVPHLISAGWYQVHTSTHLVLVSTYLVSWSWLTQQSYPQAV